MHALTLLFATGILVPARPAALELDDDLLFVLELLQGRRVEEGEVRSVAAPRLAEGAVRSVAEIDVRAWTQLVKLIRRQRRRSRALGVQGIVVAVRVVRHFLSAPIGDGSGVCTDRCRAGNLCVVAQ